MQIRMLLHYADVNDLGSTVGATHESPLPHRCELISFYSILSGFQFRAISPKISNLDEKLLRNFNR